jgi:hypothetical protein
MTCKVCGKPVNQCKSPISHSCPTTNTIKLPSSVSHIRATDPSKYSQRDVQALNEFHP